MSLTTFNSKALVEQTKIILIVFVVLQPIFLSATTTFIPRCLSSDQTFELVNTNYNFHHQKYERSGSLEIKPVYQRSFHGQKNAPFFLSEHKKCISVREDGTGDVDSLWLNLIAAAPNFYQSNITLKPGRTLSGFVGTFYTYLPCIAQSLWLGINAAVVHAHHALHFAEYKRPYQGTLASFANAYEALSNAAWCAGRFYCKPRTHTGVDDVQIKIGYDAFSWEMGWVAPYLLATIPTGKKISPEFIFEPIVGSRHGSMGLGIDLAVKVYEQSCGSLQFMCDANYRYVFSAQERRLFDLRHNGDWSRYLLVATAAQPYNSLPGNNFFTNKAAVTPGSTFQTWLAVHYQQGNWHSELGYNLWVRGREKIKLNYCKNMQAVGIFDLSGICHIPATSASSATIAQGVIGSNALVKDPVFVTEHLSNLNVCSAENTTAITNKISGSCGYTFRYTKADLFIGMNISGEFSVYSNALNSYAVWAQCGISF